MQLNTHKHISHTDASGLPSFASNPNKKEETQWPKMISLLGVNRSQVLCILCVVQDISGMRCQRGESTCDPSESIASQPWRWDEYAKLAKSEMWLNRRRLNGWRLLSLCCVWTELHFGGGCDLNMTVADNRDFVFPCKSNASSIPSTREHTNRKTCFVNCRIIWRARLLCRSSPKQQKCERSIVSHVKIPFWPKTQRFKLLVLNVLYADWMPLAARLRFSRFNLNVLHCLHEQRIA